MRKLLDLFLNGVIKLFMKEHQSNEVLIIDVFGSYQSPNKLLTIFKKK